MTEVEKARQRVRRWFRREIEASIKPLATVVPKANLGPRQLVLNLPGSKAAGYIDRSHLKQKR